MTTILTLLAIAIFSPSGENMTVRQGQAVTVNVSRESSTGSSSVANNPLYQSAGNSGTNPLYK